MFNLLMNTDVAEHFKLIGLYALNRIDQPKFDAFMARAYNNQLSASYLQDKWEEFLSNQMSFMVSHISFTEMVVQEIIDTEYNG